jgi:ABC-type multidrug transport system ATPase subunit/pSer/pThr/pTyr-binding forkhead associated (FHA) protein
MNADGSVAPELQTAALLYDGRRIAVDSELSLGRGDDNDVVLPDERASRHHARIGREGDGFTITDLGSKHGTQLNGELLSDQTRPLETGDAIAIGGQQLRFLAGGETRMASREVPITDVQTVAFEGERLSIGRDLHNDAVLDNPNVSRFHAELVRDGDGVELRDLGSRNGIRLDGALVDRGRVVAGSKVGIGPYALIFDGSSFVARDDQDALRLDASEVAVQIKEKWILEPTSLSIAPGEFVAIIGESGAGKTTLLKALAGVNRSSAGQITLNGEDLLARLTDVGYVPQDDIVHRLLTVREALRYAARLRLPQDVSDDEVNAAVDRVLDELSLQEQADTPVGSLSGGQRKRTGVAAELLSRPSVLFLDEPTTGLDPGLETQMMELFRELSRGGRAVTVVTHATKNLALCDRVVVMGRGGVLTFDGPPADASRFFGVDDYDGIYTALPTKSPQEWSELHRSGKDSGPASPAEPLPTPARRRPHLFPQLRVLVSRYLKLLTRDRRNMLLLLGQPPVLALFGVILFEAGLFDDPGGSPGNAINMLFLMAITMIWLGAIDAAPELIKERSVMERESAIGTRLSAYISSKLIVLFGLATLQTLLYVGVLFAFRPLDASPGAYATVIGLLVVTSFVAVGMGLLVSALVTTQDQAVSLIPLAVIPQLLFGGAIVTLAQMAALANAISQLVFGQWALAGLGTAIDMNARLAADPEFAQVNRFGTDFFNLPAGQAFAILGAFLLVFVSSTALLLRRRLA